jgi:hypothetical protein
VILVVIVVLAMTPVLIWWFFIDVVPRLERWRRAPGPNARTACERYGSTLRRLKTEHDRLLVPGGHPSAFQVRALEAAYDETLRQACSELRLGELPHPLDPISRLTAEAELALHGVDW